MKISFDEAFKQIQPIIAQFNQMVQVKVKIIDTDTNIAIGIEVNAGTPSTSGKHLRITIPLILTPVTKALTKALDEVGIHYQVKAKGRDGLLIINAISSDPACIDLPPEFNQKLQSALKQSTIEVIIQIIRDTIQKLFPDVGLEFNPGTASNPGYQLRIISGDFFKIETLKKMFSFSNIKYKETGHYPKRMLIINHATLENASVLSKDLYDNSLQTVKNEEGLREVCHAIKRLQLPQQAKVELNSNTLNTTDFHLRVMNCPANELRALTKALDVYSIDFQLKTIADSKVLIVKKVDYDKVDAINLNKNFSLAYESELKILSENTSKNVLKH